MTLPRPCLPSTRRASALLALVLSLSLPARAAAPASPPAGEDVVRLSEFASDQRDRVAELDVNPIIVSGSDAVAVDALIVRAGA